MKQASLDNLKRGRGWNKGKSLTKEHRDKLRASNIGQKRSSEFRKKLSKAHKGMKKPWVKGHFGEKNPHWKGGITPIHEAIRRSKEYKLWRDAVKKRDGYKCIWCGLNKKLEADHIKPFCDYPELRFAIDNGRTLCNECHKRTNTYGKRRKILLGE